MSQHSPKDVKRIVKNSDDLELYLAWLRAVQSYTVEEASLVSGFSEDVIRSAMQRGELNLSVPNKAKSGRILRKSLEDWMQNNEVSLEIFYKIKKVG